jgi:tryptophan synthase alpha chain
MSRLRNRIRELNRSGDKALGIFVTAGYPSMADTAAVIDAIDSGGADFIELGMPFSDPLAEGLPIQMSSASALAGGVTMNFSFETASKFRSRSETPLLLMGYVNPILQYGISNFFSRCQSSGIDAVILPDYPVHSRLPIRDEARKFEIDLVHLVAPTTPDERVRELDSLSGGFVYAVSMTGLTGTSMPERDVVTKYLSNIRDICTNNPVLVGFGISSADDVRALSKSADGCIVGSAIIRKIEHLWSESSISPDERLTQLSDFVIELKSGTT